MNPSVPVSAAAVSTICGYPLAKRRKDMPSREYTTYKSDWDTFNRIWTYDYAVSTLNGRGSQEMKYSYYYFSNYSEKMSYIAGQNAHVTYYTGIAPIGTFDTIR